MSAMREACGESFGHPAGCGKCGKSSCKSLKSLRRDVLREVREVVANPLKSLRAVCGREVLCITYILVPPFWWGAPFLENTFSLSCQDGFL